MCATLRTLPETEAIALFLNRKKPRPGLDSASEKYDRNSAGNKSECGKALQNFQQFGQHLLVIGKRISFFGNAVFGKIVVDIWEF